MPTYRYTCSECGERFEALRPIDERDEPAECPQCGSDSNRIATAAGVVFNGTGWYESDYKRKDT